MRSIVPFVLLIALVISATVVHAQYSTLQDTRTYDIVNRFVVENTGKYSVTQVKAKVYVGGSNESLYQQKVRYRVIPTQRSKSVDSLGNIFVNIDLGTLESHEKKYITVEKIVNNSGIAFSNDVYQLQPDYSDFLRVPANQQFVKPSKHIESDAPEILDAVTHLDSSKPVAQQALDIHLGVNGYLEYDPDTRYAHQGALSALKTRRGVCTEFAGLFVAFCRAIHIPARVVSGYWLHLDKPMAMHTPVSVKGVRHAWAEFYVPNVGWIPAELTALQYIQYPDTTKRFSNADSFAVIRPDDRHFVWGYGLETEREPTIQVNGMILDDTDNPFHVDLIEESVTLLPDEQPVQ